MKIRRSTRLVDMTVYFMKNPNTITPLNYFTDKFKAAKSSISEDLAIIKDSFEENNLGSLITYAGARGGVQYQPNFQKDQLEEEINALRDELNGSERLLPGGYIYTSDLLGDPNWLKRIGKMIASKYEQGEVDAILTIATKGVPLAQSVAYNLNVPFYIVRKSTKVTEGSTVSINYLPWSSAEQVERMTLTRNTLKPNSKVLIIDDFLRGGGTIKGMERMVEEFNGEVVDSVVLLEHTGDEINTKTHSLLKVVDVNKENETIKVDVGNFLSL